MHPKLEEAKKMMDMMRSLVDVDLYFAIFDQNAVILYLYPEVDASSIGMHIGGYYEDPTGKLQKVLKTGKRIHNHVPTKKFGFALEGNLLPIFDDGKVIGCVAVSYIPTSKASLEAQQIALQSIYGMIMSVNSHNDKCTEVYQSHTLGLSDISIVRFSAFCEESAGLIHPDDREDYLEFTHLSTLEDRLSGHNNISRECRLLFPDGEYRWMEFIMTRVWRPSEPDEMGIFLYMVRDVHNRKNMEEMLGRENRLLIEELERLNSTLFQKGIRDELTGLYNRKGLEHFENSIFRTALNEDNLLFASVLDIDGLKYINDNFGHESGDLVISTLGRLIGELACQNAICARTGGDEFVVISSFTSGDSCPQEFVSELTRRIDEFNHASKLPYSLKASIGWFSGKPEYDKNIEDYIRIADNSMYQMKAERKTLSNLKSAHNRLMNSSKPKILLADPDMNSAQFKSDYSVFTALNETEFLEILSANESFDLIILDVERQALNGLNILKKFHDAGQLSRQPIVVTSHSADETLLLDYAEEITEWLTKPVNPDFFMARAKFILQKFSEHKQMEALLNEKSVILEQQTQKLQEQATILGYNFSKSNCK